MKQGHRTRILGCLTYFDLFARHAPLNVARVACCVSLGAQHATSDEKRLPCFDENHCNAVWGFVRVSVTHNADVVELVDTLS